MAYRVCAARKKSIPAKCCRGMQTTKKKSAPTVQAKPAANRGAPFLPNIKANRKQRIMEK